MNKMNRKSFLSQASILTASLYLPSWYKSFAPSVSEYIETATTYGRVRGSRLDGVNIFKGIPYAGKVSGDRRFRKPAPLEAWQGIRDALELGAPAIQPPRRNEPAPSEDCLFLNVWTPDCDNKKRPVMFYNHGGGFVIGSGGSPGQDGSNLARFFDVVVVETNHRLGLFGFLYLDEVAGPDYAGSGNMGLLDIIEGLKWVKENISEFGGDPDNVMIFGESGGGAKTSCLYGMPGAAPYFNKASIESGPGVRMSSKESASATTAKVLEYLRLAPREWRKILEVPASTLLEIQSKFAPVAPHLDKGQLVLGFGPVVDGVALLSHPFDPVAPALSNDKPLITGWNEDEYNFFAWQSHDTESFKLDFGGLREKLLTRFHDNTDTIIDTYRRSRPGASAPDLFVAISSVTMMGLGSVDIAEKKASQHGAPVYLYNFGYKSEMKIPGTDYPIGTPHAMDISFKFNNEVPGRGPGFLSGNNPDRFIASHKMAELWTSFALTGRPSAKDVPPWPSYNLVDRPTMRINTDCEIIYNRFKDELAMWRSIGML